VILVTFLYDSTWSEYKQTVIVVDGELIVNERPTKLGDDRIFARSRSNEPVGSRHGSGGVELFNQVHHKLYPAQKSL
jgi:hypothetical protein